MYCVTYFHKLNSEILTKIMKETHFCTCCLSKECYKDMANNYYFGNKTENYLEMLLSVFNINVPNADGRRCLICESCVTKLRDAAVFKQKVLKTQETITKKLSWLKDGDDSTMEPKVEDNDLNDFDDDISDHFNDDDFVWDTNTQASPQGDIMVIKLEAQDEEENLPISTILKLNGNNKSTINTNRDEGTPSKEDGVTKKSGVVTRSAKTVANKKAVTANRSKDKKQSKRRQPDINSVHTRENTLKLIQNSNLCIFRSHKNEFGCFLCKTKLLDISQLREHSATHSNTKLIMRKVRSLRGLSYRNADISNLECNLCSEKLSSLPELINHLKKEHNIVFNGADHFLIPYKLHGVFDDGFQCVLCEEKFNSYLRLSIHMNTHYTFNVCEMCGQSFINRVSLRTHVQSQHKEKKCSVCPLTFLTSSAKVRHMKNVHKLLNSKRHCNICKKTFRYTYKLEKHKIEEHGAKRQISDCELCGKTFFSVNNLKIHIRSVHIKERNYPCSICGMRFFTKCDQKRHEKTHEDVRSFFCSHCDGKFKSKDSWRRHLKRQHGQTIGDVS